MPTIHERFTQALSDRLNGRFDQLRGSDPRAMLPAARCLDDAGQVVAACSARALGSDHADSLSGLPVSQEFLRWIPIGFARRNCLLGLSPEPGTLTIALSDPGQWAAAAAVAARLGRPFQPLFCPPEEILRAINAAYQQQAGQTDGIIEQMDTQRIWGGMDADVSAEDLLDGSGRAPVVKLVNSLLFEAVQRRASDVHVHPYESRLTVRFRIDGVLHDVFNPPKACQAEVISRIKVMGGMNIAERRLAQDGRSTVQVGDRIVDLRISTLPTSFGERAVIRLLDKSARLYELPELGMPAGMLGHFADLIGQDHGIILVTGPTGSGKSTTLYAALQELNAGEMNILTLEDPIEYRLEGISQTQVNDRKGMTFASGLRHVLRQDPDVIMVGEIRDSETARMAIQSALTGHLVFSTLHTNDAAGAVARLLDLGIEPYLIASSLLGVLAQRLVRRVCPHCATSHVPLASEWTSWGLTEAPSSDARLRRGTGCASCLGTGFRERVGIFELLTVTEPIRQLVLQQAKASSIKAAALSDGMTTLRGDGTAKALAGLTTFPEVLRVTGRDEF